MSPSWIIFSRTLEPQMMVWISNHWQSYSIIFNPFNLQELPTTLWPKISCVSRGTLKSTRMNTRRSRTFTLLILDTKKRNCQLWSQQVSSMFRAEKENLKPPAKAGKCFSLSSFIAMSHETNWAKIASNQAKCPFWTSMTMTFLFAAMHDCFLPQTQVPRQQIVSHFDWIQSKPDFKFHLLRVDPHPL